jgi:hypothetical protein
MDYLNCIGLEANHGQQGPKMFENLSKWLYQGRKTEAFTQLDSNFKTGFYPQISLLDELHEVEPNSTLVFNFRPMADWIHSVTHWHGLRARMSQFLVPGLVMTPPPRQRSEDIRDTGEKNRGGRKPIMLTGVQLAKWWCGHVLHIRDYVQEYPSHALIELDLYDSNGTASILYDLFQADTDAYLAQGGGGGGDASSSGGGSTVSCWGQSNKSNNKKVKKND